MKGNRAPVMVDVLYSLEWFLLFFSACIPFICKHTEDPILTCVRLLPAAAAYAATALAVRLVRIPALRLAFPILLAAGCIFIGSSATERVLLAIMGIFSIVCGLVIHFGLRRGSPKYNNMLIFIPLLVVYSFILGKFDMVQAVSLTNLVLAVFLPIFAAVWYLNRFDNSVSIFTMRTDQPIDRISKRMYKTIGTTALLILFITLLVPQSGGVNYLFSLIETGIAGIFAILILIISLLPVSENPELADEFGMAQTQPLDMGSDSIWDVYLVYAVAAVILILLAISAVSMLIKLLRYLISGFMHYDGTAAPQSNGNDTIEKIERRSENRSKERLGRTNAGKIRKIYKRRVSSVLGNSLGRLSSCTPTEIAALCSKKGEDITELTKLYKKARYTNNCTEEDVKKAKQL